MSFGPTAPCGIERAATALCRYSGPGRLSSPAVSGRSRDPPCEGTSILLTAVPPPTTRSDDMEDLDDDGMDDDDEVLGVPPAPEPRHPHGSPS